MLKNGKECTSVELEQTALKKTTRCGARTPRVSTWGGEVDIVGGANSRKILLGSSVELGESRLWRKGIESTGMCMRWEKTGRTKTKTPVRAGRVRLQ